MDGTDQHKSRPVVTALISIVMLGAVIVYYLTYGVHGALQYTLNASIPTPLWIEGTLLKYGLSILCLAGLIWAAVALARKPLKVADGGHFYILAYLTGITYLLLNFTTVHLLNRAAIYDQLLPLLRNSQPLITGVLLYVCVQPPLKRWLHERELRTLGLFLLTVPLVFNKDIFMLGNGSSVLGVAVIAALGLVTVDNGVHLPARNLLWFLFGGAGTIGYGYWMQSANLNIESSSRFVGMLSPLTVLPALVIVRWALRLSASADLIGTSTQLQKSDRGQRFAVWAGALLMAGGTWSSATASAFGKLELDFAALHLFWLVPAAIVFAVVAAVAALLATAVAERTWLWRQLDRNWQLSPTDAWRHFATTWRAGLGSLWGHYWRPLLAFGLLFCVQVASALLMNQSFQTMEGTATPNLNIFSVTILLLTPNMLVGTIALLAIYWVLLSLTDRYWTSLLTTVAIGLGIAAASVIKIAERSEPIVPSDLSELKATSELMGMLNPVLVSVAVIAIVAAAVAIGILQHRAKPLNQPLLYRVLKFGLAAAYIVSLGTLNHNFNYSRNVITSMGVSLQNNNELTFAQANGPIMQFATSLDVHAMAKPSGYSKAAVLRIVRKYQRAADQQNQHRSKLLKNETVLFNLSESFADPTRIPQLNFNRDPIPYIHQLQKQTTSGYMMSFGYGGGTADMEYMTLTGFNNGNFDSTINTPYTQLVPKLKANPNIGNNFNYASAIHPYTGSFYNRPEVYQRFKFNKFVYLDSKYPIIDQHRLGKSPYMSDRTSYANALAQINARKGGQFINLITIQNHMPFNDWYKSKFKVQASTATLTARKSQIETYAQGINYTDQAVKAFKAKIDKINKPIIWVFYGDHLPGIYAGLTDEVLMHKTDYFIYSNKYAREHGARKMQGKDTMVSPNDFIAMALKQGNIKVDPYSELLTQTHNQLPAQWTKTVSSRDSSTYGTTFVNDQGQTLDYKKLSQKQKQLFHDYQMIQYDINVGKQYSYAAGMMK
ncbi:LTA synthase family protein [Lacticaseibacillus zhaodongensis]|uniref:LTA synthase family protein n=1 Tax=Lacticaseibacillus zhaodongensis TaxID=2668065 RepID=UPI0012D2E708|nr:LTA synthase family protein [Lacticaseibacillus zhaodongensis]